MKFPAFRLRSISLFSFLFFFVFFCKAQDALKSYTAVNVAKAPKIDGNPDDEAWQQALPASDFTMTRPIEKSIPTQKTEFRIVYDNSAVYVLGVMYDTAPDSILHELGLRDGKDPSGGSNNYVDLNSDLFRLVIDPYNKRQDGYDFGVYASGVQADSKLGDPTFDAVWESAARINDRGWVVEMKIPYSAIRFPKKSIQEWGLQITRNIRRNREFDQWCLTPSGCFNPLLYWGNLKGIENVKPPVRLSLTPYISAYAESSPNYLSDSTYSFSRGMSWRGGADIKYGIDERFTLDMTLLPDFGQVQSDRKIKTLGYEEVTYDENRPFFKEGTDLFNKSALFYTRRIGKKPEGHDQADTLIYSGETLKSNPEQVKLINSTKVSGRTDGGLGLGLFNAVTDNTYAIAVDSLNQTRKILTEPLTNYSVFVVDQVWKNGNNLSLINTNVSRDKKYNDANVTGTNLTLVDKKKNYAMDASVNLSQQFYKTDSVPGGFRDSTGFYYFIGGRKSSGKFQYGISRTVYSSSYNPKDLGYYVTSGRERNQVYVNYYLFQPWKFLRDANMSLVTSYTTEFKTKDRTNFSIDYSAFTTLLDYNSYFAGGGVTPAHSRDYDPRLNGRFVKAPRYFYVYGGLSSDYRKRIALDLTETISNFIDTHLGEDYNTSIGLRFRLSDKLTVNYFINYHFNPFDFGFVNEDASGNYIYGYRKTNTYENRFTIRYIFVPDMSLSLNARHYWFNGQYTNLMNLENDGNLTDMGDIKLIDPTGSNNFSYNYFNLDVLYSWRFSPGSTISVSYKNLFEPQTNRQTEYITSDFVKNKNFVFENPHANTFSVKLLYYLDYLYLRKKSVK